MSEPLKKTDAIPDQVPSRIPEDLIPAWLWLKDNGASWLATIAVAVLLVVGYSVYMRHRDNKTAAASQQMLAQPANTPLENVAMLEKAVADHGSSQPGTAVKLKLAKAYCDAGQYDKALSTYDAFIKQHGSHPFADVAQVGRGFALLGQTRTEDALTLFRSFRTQNPHHYLAPQTIFGEAACLAQQGKKDEAKALLQDLRAANRETAWEAAAKRMEGAIDRYQGQALQPMHSLLEQANALAPVMAPPVPAPVAVPAPAPTPTPSTPVAAP